MAPPSPKTAALLSKMSCCGSSLGDDDAPCCGPRLAPPSSPHERPGYRLCPFVESFIDTPAGPVPVVKTRLEPRDRLGNAAVRLNIGRNDYKVAPGLYAVGSPDPAAPVLVTANYKLSFDALRRHLAATSAWIMVLDTRGINVWCAAGKKTFSTAEVIRRVGLTGLDKVVTHRRLILPQLGAVGVSAHQVKKACGFEVIWGPVRAADIEAFIAAGHKATAAMRAVTFTMAERLVLIPVELSFLPKPLAWAMAAAFLLSGIGPGIFSLGAAIDRGVVMALACLAGIAAGAAAVPALLPWLPGRSFSLKGVITGAGAATLMVTCLPAAEQWPGVLGLTLVILATSSYLAMNFTGSTPFTSPSGVEKEMRRAIPLQAGAVVVAVLAWVAGAFVGG